MFTRIRTIHIAVSNVKEATKDFAERFGLKVTRSGEMPVMGIRNAFMPVGNTNLEIVEPLDPSQGPLAKFLQTRGEGIYMMAVEVDDVEEAVKQLQAKGVRLINAEPENRAKGIPPFIHPKSAHGIMIELVEKPK
ncbi:MAG: VOC family protein [Dehalococcoidales bacterium]|nr:VOC family protein [Dehalococcoidales bacterium]